MDISFVIKGVRSQYFKEMAVYDNNGDARKINYTKASFEDLPYEDAGEPMIKIIWHDCNITLPENGNEWRPMCDRDISVLDKSFIDGVIHNRELTETPTIMRIELIPVGTEGICLLETVDVFEVCKELVSKGSCTYSAELVTLYNEHIAHAWAMDYVNNNRMKEGEELAIRHYQYQTDRGGYEFGYHLADVEEITPVRTKKMYRMTVIHPSYTKPAMSSTYEDYDELWSIALRTASDFIRETETNVLYDKPHGKIVIKNTVSGLVDISIDEVDN